MAYSYCSAFLKVFLSSLICAELDPMRRRQSRQDHRESSTGEGSRYVKLKTKDVMSPDGYTKPLRARSLDGEFPI